MSGLIGLMGFGIVAFIVSGPRRSPPASSFLSSSKV